MVHIVGKSRRVLCIITQAVRRQCTWIEAEIGSTWGKGFAVWVDCCLKSRALAVPWHADVLKIVCRAPYPPPPPKDFFFLRRWCFTYESEVETYVCGSHKNLRYWRTDVYSWPVFYCHLYFVPMLDLVCMGAPEKNLKNRSVVRANRQHNDSRGIIYLLYSSHLLAFYYFYDNF